jgi:hypothetical protein
VITGLLFLGGGSLVFYAQTLTAVLDGTPISARADLPYALVAAGGAVVFGLSCETMTRKMR